MQEDSVQMNTRLSSMQNNCDELKTKLKTQENLTEQWKFATIGMSIVSAFLFLGGLL